MFVNNTSHSNQSLKVNEEKFKNNLREIFFKVGIKNEPIVFIIDKVDAIEEGIQLLTI